jgi:hypothetical protein
MRQAGVRRAKWGSDYNGSERQSLAEGERRVVYLVADGHLVNALRERGELN